MPSKSQRKPYPINQSPLFRIRGKGQFEKIIGVAWNAVPDLIAANGYRVWVNEKNREIQAPAGWLASVHQRIGDLFSRIELPDYLFSKKGRSYADNARTHLGDHPLIKTDIHRFYPSVKRSMVFRMFAVDFQCADDVAANLADICCYKQEHLPTGSPLSGRIAFHAAKHMFDQVAELAHEADCRMTAFVDDITVSGKGATKKLLGNIRKIVHQHGLKTKQKKSKTFAAGAAKLVTGAVVVGNEVRLPNVRHKKIHTTRRELAAASGVEQLRLRRILKGRLQEARQILSTPSPNRTPDFTRLEEKT